MCTEESLHLAELKKSRGLNVPLVIVTPGAPAATAGFLRDIGLYDDVEGYADPSLAVYKQLGLAYIAKAADLGKGPKPKVGCCRITGILCWAMCCRCRCPGGSAGDYHQVGGCFVFGAGGMAEQHYALRQETPGYPEIDDAALVAAVDAASKGLAPAAGYVAPASSAAGGALAAAAASGVTTV